MALASVIIAGLSALVALAAFVRSGQAQNRANDAAIRAERSALASELASLVGELTSIRAEAFQMFLHTTLLERRADALNLPPDVHRLLPGIRATLEGGLKSIDEYRGELTDLVDRLVQGEEPAANLGEQITKHRVFVAHIAADVLPGGDALDSIEQSIEELEESERRR